MCVCVCVCDCLHVHVCSDDQCRPLRCSPRAVRLLQRELSSGPAINTVAVTRDHSSEYVL